MSFMTLFTTCKNPAIDYDTFSITDQTIQPEKDKVSISGTYDFLGEVMGMQLNIGLDEQLADAESHPMHLENQSFSVTVEGLEPGQPYHYCYLVEFDNNHKLLTDIGVFSTRADKPVVRTLEVKAIDSVSFRVKSIVDNDFGMAITERGVCWGLTDNPTLSGNHLAHHENGVGQYSCNITGLELGTTYYVRAYAKNEMGLSYANEVLRFETDSIVTPPHVEEAPIVETLPVNTSSITQTSAVCKGRIISEGSSPVTQRGICWSTSSNPNINGNHSSINLDENEFEVTLTDLTPNTTYHFCAYATNSVGTSYGEDKTFKTLALNTFVIAISCSPEAGGQAEGGGEYEEGEVCELNATANAHYSFKKWTESGHMVSENAHFSFTVESNRTLVANFEIDTYTISATASPSNGGTVSGVGNGVYEYGQTCTLTANANDGYEFEKWTDNSGNTVSSQNPYSFTVTDNRQLVAHFNELPPQVPQGAIDALFSVSASQKVYFSQGNLQYRASSPGTWRFAENQYTTIGPNNSNIAPHYGSWIDLFGWGTGDNPTNSSTQSSDYPAFNDWGNNSIYNGGQTAGLWRTLTKQEWTYVFNTRQASTINGTADARYAKATVNSVKGVILFPDTFVKPSGVTILTSSINNPSASFDNNTYSVNQWSTLEAKGCVFLPVTGWRQGTNVHDTNTNGYYWSSSQNSSDSAFGLRFYDSNLSFIGGSKSVGQSVRLVYPAR